MTKQIISTQKRNSNESCQKKRRGIIKLQNKQTKRKLSREGK